MNMGIKGITDETNGDFYSDENAVEAEFEDVSGLQGDLDEQLHSIFSEIGGEADDIDYEIRAYRPQKGKGAMGYLFACTPEELPIMDKLRDDYGGGTFQVRVLRNKKIFRRKTVIIEPPLKKPEQPMIDATSNMAEVMAQGFMRLGELIVTTNAAPPVQPGGGMADMINNMVAMKTLMGEPAPAINPLAQLKD